MRRLRARLLAHALTKERGTALSCWVAIKAEPVERAGRSPNDSPGDRRIVANDVVANSERFALTLSPQGTPGRCFGISLNLNRSAVDTVSSHQPLAIPIHRISDYRQQRRAKKP